MLRLPDWNESFIEVEIKLHAFKKYLIWSLELRLYRHNLISKVRESLEGIMLSITTIENIETEIN